MDMVRCKISFVTIMLEVSQSFWGQFYVFSLTADCTLLVEFIHQGLQGACWVERRVSAGGYRPLSGLVGQAVLPLHCEGVAPMGGAAAARSAHLHGVDSGYPAAMSAEPEAEMEGTAPARLLRLLRIADASGTVDRNPPAIAGDAGSIPGLGRSHMAWNR